MNEKKSRRLRTKSGGAMIGFVLALILFVLFLGLFAFDTNRAQLCQRELIAACDAASIAGTAMLASYDTSPGGNVTLAQAQQNAGGYARNMFQDQVVLGQSLANASLQTSPGALYAGVTSPRQCNALVALGNPDNNFASVNIGDPLGRTVMVFCCYGYQPSFLSSVPFAIQVVPLRASSYGGLPQVDAVVVFDYSGSMDDFTSVLFVRREWYWPPNSTAVGSPLYSVVTGNNSKTITDNKLVDYINWQWDVSVSAHAGTATNVLPPQTLEGVGSSTAYGGAIGNPLYYNSTLRANPIFCQSFLGSLTAPPKPAGSAPATIPAYSSWKSFTGQPLTLSSNDYGQPPGNYKPVFVSGDGITPMTPLAWATQYQNSNTGGKINPPAAWAPSVQNFGYPPFANKYSDYTVPSSSTSATDLQGDNITFTDLVVNIIDPTSGGTVYQSQPIPAVGAPVYSSLSNTGQVFSGFSMTFPADEPDTRLAGKTFNFANLATLVEAARGNLDNNTNYHGACLDGNILIRNGALASTVVGPSTTTTVTISAPGNTNFQLAYERIAMLESQPYATAVDGAVNGFFYKLSTLCDARFGLVGFSGITASGNDYYGLSQTGGPSAYTTSVANFNSQGQSPSDSCYHSELEQYINSSGNASIFGNCNYCWWRTNQTLGKYPSAAAQGPLAPYTSEQVAGTGGNVSGQKGFKIPRVPISDSLTQLNLVTSTLAGASPYNTAPFGDIWSGTSSNTNADGVWNGRPLTDTYCDEALQTAYNSFFKNTGSYNPTNRRAARKAIVFFTDGEPTGGIGAAGSGSGSSVAQNSFSVATLCSNNGVSLYTIGLNASLNSTITNDQYQFLGDSLETSHNPDNGIASVAGNGSRFFACQTGADVRAAFASIARRLSQSQQ